MQDNYWSKCRNTRVGRRRALAATGGVAAAAAFLAACGSDDDDAGTTTGGTSPTAVSGGTTGDGTTPSGGGGDTGGLLTQPVHRPPSEAKKGGIFRTWARAEPRNLDPISAQAALNDNTEMVYESLLDEKPGLLAPEGYVLTGRLAESWETSPDGLTNTLKLRQGVKWHDLPPVNGRAFDSSDVLAALERYAEIGPLSTLIYDSAGAGGPVLTPTAPDASTVVLKLNAPVSYMINYFAPYGGITATQLQTPREANDGTLDVRTDMVGTGPYYLSRHEPSVAFEYTKNEEHWDADNYLLGEIHQPIVPEYVQRLAQFQAGAIYQAWNYTQGLRATDVLTLKNDQPKILLYAGPTNLASSVFTFGVQGTNNFEDERVRQAFSMAFDRDLDINLRNNIDEFEEAGIPITKFWNSHLAARDGNVGGGWWLDPQSSEFGENAKFFQYNVPEAKKLLAAAGFPDGFEVGFRYPNTAAFDRANVVEPYFFYLQELGLTVDQNGQTDYTQDYIPNNRDASGAYEGIGYHSVTGSVPSVVSPVSAMVAEHLPLSGVTFHGYSAGGGTAGTGDPALNEILTKARTEADVDTAKSLIHEAQRYLGKAMWSMIESGGSNGIYAAWPAVQNFRVWQVTPSSWKYYQIWLDDTKAPLA